MQQLHVQSNKIHVVQDIAPSVHVHIYTVHPTLDNTTEHTSKNTIRVIQLQH